MIVRMRAWIAILVMGAAACSSQPGPGQAGGSCNDSNVTCTSGTQCLTESVMLASGCSSMEKICTVACSTDDPCVALFGNGAHCSTSCSTDPDVCIPP